MSSGPYVQTVRGGCPPNSRRASGSYHARRDGKWGRVWVRAVIDGSMSALGQTETRALRRSMSVLPPGAEMCMTGPLCAEKRLPFANRLLWGFALPSRRVAYPVLWDFCRHPRPLKNALAFKIVLQNECFSCSCDDYVPLAEQLHPFESFCLL